MRFWDENQKTVKIKEKEYTLSENDKLFKEWDLNGEGVGFYNLTRTDILTKIENPGVPLILVVSRGFKTLKKAEYDVDLFESVK